MPTRIHRARREPPSLTDRWLAHPIETHAFGGTWTALGALLTWTWIDPGGGPATVLQHMHPWIAGAVAVALLFSGLGILLAIAWTGKDSTSWRIELSALPLGVFAWSSYVIAASSPYWIIMALGMASGAAVRWWAIWVNTKDPKLTLVVDSETAA